MKHLNPAVLAFGIGALLAGFVGGWILRGSTEPAAWYETPTIPQQAEEFAAPAGSSSTRPTTTEPPPVFLATLFVDPATDIPDGNGTVPSSPLLDVESALDLAVSGDTIYLAPGIYPPIKIRDTVELTLEPWPDRPGDVIVTDGDYGRTAALLVEDSARIEIRGLVLTESLWGVMVRRSSEITIEETLVEDVGQEGIHIKDNSRDILIRANTIRETGQRPGGPGDFGFAKFGEGIYLGTGGEVDDPDVTSRVVVEENDISATTAEAIDVKPFVREVEIRRNFIHDLTTNTSGAVVVGIGNDLYDDPQVVISENVIWNIATSTRFTDGNGIRVSAAATIVANVIFNTEHHAVLADGGFVNVDANTVRLVANVAFGTAEPAFESWDTPNPAILDTSENTSDEPWPAAPLDPQGLPSEALLDLVDRLTETASTK